jgi:hypothetical protein
MKSQRSFVVERKSSRRRPKAETSSIWGDTDFKALARAAEAEAPNIFKAQAEQPAAVVEAIIEAPAPAADNAPAPEVIAKEKPTEAAPSIPAVKAPRPARKRVAAQQPVQSSRKTAAQPSQVFVENAVMTYGALLELEGANRKLIAQLRARFEVEHAQLVQMLERADVRNNAG